MRFGFIAGAALLALGMAGRPACAAPAASGDYIEARSCNVYAGACHAEGEYTTAGRQAILAWNVRHGSYENVTLDGAAALALVVADRNLGAPGAEKKAVIYVSGTPEQRDAMVKMLEDRAAASLGKVLAVKTAQISFNDKGELYRVDAPGVASLSVKKQPGQLCCLQAYQVWYKPFVALKDSKIGYSVLSKFDDKTLNVSWAGSEQNNAYFGNFTL